MGEVESVHECGAEDDGRAVDPFMDELGTIGEHCHDWVITSGRVYDYLQVKVLQ